MIGRFVLNALRPGLVTRDEMITLIRTLVVGGFDTTANTIALGTLKGNPFADSSREFFGDVEALVHTAVDHRLEIATPFSELDKAHVLELGRHLRLQHTFSCIDPTAGVHCGRCNKCAERQRAFAEASIDDVTTYANR